MSKNVLGIIITVVAIGAVGLIVLQANKSNAPPAENTSNQGASQTQNQSSDSSSRAITKAEVAGHNKKSDCWTIINNEVYDITRYIPRHPGGDEILRACGNDATSLFNNRQTEEGQSVGSGTSHSSSARNTLQDFRIGNLSQ